MTRTTEALAECLAETVCNARKHNASVIDTLADLIIRMSGATYAPVLNLVPIGSGYQPAEPGPEVDADEFDYACLHAHILAAIERRIVNAAVDGAMKRDPAYHLVDVARLICGHVCGANASSITHDAARRLFAAATGD